MTYDTTKKVLNYEGQELLSPTGKNNEKTPLTFFDVITSSLNGTLPNETLTADKKAMLFQLTKKIYNKKTNVHFTEKEIEVITDRVGKAYPALTYGRLCEFLKGEEPEAPESDAPKEEPNPKAN